MTRLWAQITSLAFFSSQLVRSCGCTPLPSALQTAIQSLQTTQPAADIAATVANIVHGAAAIEKAAALLTASSTPAQKAQIACAISQQVFPTGYIDATNTTGYPIEETVNW